MDDQVDRKTEHELRGYLAGRLDRLPVTSVPRFAHPHPGWLRRAAMVPIVVVLMAAAVVAGLALGDRRAQPQAGSQPPSASPTSLGAPVLSADQKSVIANDQVLLAIEDEQIVDWFRTKSQLCGSNITSTPDRRTFCEDNGSFRDQTRFAAIIVSPDGTKVGFTIESAILPPDTAAGMFLRSTGKVHFVSHLYYLGERFIGFSPAGTTFVYQGDCVQGKCGLRIFDSATLAERASLNNPTTEERQLDATFVRWISDNEVEYRLGTELRRAAF
jgi:hypothetical protein